MGVVYSPNHLLTIIAKPLLKLGHQRTELLGLEQHGIAARRRFFNKGYQFIRGRRRAGVAYDLHDNVAADARHVTEIYACERGGGGHA